uniref:Uncharacterized protein n=1 Tax=Avena sativa TaxID=4498 RepID=A0ACD5TPC0_AVESA
MLSLNSEDDQSSNDSLLSDIEYSFHDVGPVCKAVEWVDLEWPDALKKCLAQLWEMYELKRSGRFTDMKKKKGVAGSAISVLWEKSAKAKKTNETSTPNQSAVASSTSNVQPESSLQLALVQAPDAEGEPERRGATPTPIVEGEPDRRGATPTPIVEGDEAIDEEVESTQVDLEALEHDPGKRIPISRYAVNDHDRDRTKCPGGDSFVNPGFRNWNMKPRLKKHEGQVSSAHAEAQEKFDMFTTPKASIQESLASNTSQYKTLYKLRVTWTLKCLRFLLRQGLAFRGHDESEDSLNKGNFLELLNWLAGNFEEVDRVVLNNAPQNCRMTHHDIQDELISCCAQLTTKLVMEELDGGHFAILADESSDVYQNEQLVVFLRYVDKKGRAVVMMELVI